MENQGFLSFKERVELVAEQMLCLRVTEEAWLMDLDGLITKRTPEDEALSVPNEIMPLMEALKVLKALEAIANDCQILRIHIGRYLEADKKKALVKQITTEEEREKQRELLRRLVNR